MRCRMRGLPFMKWKYKWCTMSELKVSTTATRAESVCSTCLLAIVRFTFGGKIYIQVQHGFKLASWVFGILGASPLGLDHAAWWSTYLCVRSILRILFDQKCSEADAVTILEEWHIVDGPYSEVLKTCWFGVRRLGVDVFYRESVNTSGQMWGFVGLGKDSDCVEILSARLVEDHSRQLVNDNCDLKCDRD